MIASHLHDFMQDDPARPLNLDFAPQGEPMMLARCMVES